MKETHFQTIDLMSAEADRSIKMIEELCALFEEKEYKRILINAAEIYPYYTIEDEAVRIILTFDCGMNKEFNIDTLNQIKHQITWKFINMGYRDMEFLCLFIGRNIDAMKELCTGDDVNWILDKTYRRLIIYENQKSDFLDLKEDIETIADNLNSKEGYGKTNYFSPCNIILVLSNILIFIICEWQYYRNGSMYLYEAGALSGELVTNGNYYRLATSMFLHAGAGHLFNNMLILFHLGNYLEKQIGKIKYIVLYFLSGIIAGLTSMGYNILTGQTISSVGASGAIFGVSGALAYIILINKGNVENISRRQMVIFLVLSLYAGFSGQNIDNAAHVGGLAAGFVLSAVLYKKTSSKEERSEA